MKKILIAFITILTLATGYKAQAQVSIGFNTFYTELSPYGRWIDYPDYGQVWVTDITGFEPYSNSGHWEYTTYGWTWVSDYSWGWAPFHYGRWAYIPAYGWAWVPGYEWAPAWVSWCNYGDYYGWTPLGPGMGFNIGFNSIPVNRWRFVRHQYINNANVYRHYERPVRNANEYKNVTIINNTQVNNNVTYVTGPQRQEVERLTKRKIETKEVAFSPTAQKPLVEKNQVRMYRPDVKANEGAQNIKPVNPLTKEDNPQAIQKEKIAADARQQQLQKEKQNDAQIKRSDELNKKVEQNQVKKEQQLQQLKNKEDGRVKQDDIQQQEEIKKQRLQQEQVRQQQEQAKQQQDAAQQQKIQQQNDLKKQREEQQKQQAADQQRIQQQNELKKQRAEQEQLRQQQDEIKQQKIQQEQMRQQQLQEQRREQQQQMRKQEREQKAIPRQQPQRQPQPAQPEKKGKG